MAEKKYRSQRARGGGQRIGPALRALRQREGLSLDELANRCGITLGRISRIEQGRGNVSLQDLMCLSKALGVDVTYFTSYQEAVSQTEQELSEMLDKVDVSSDAIPAFLGLGFETQGLLLDALRRLTFANAANPVREQELVEHVLSHGVAAAIPYILSGIPKFGIDMETFCRVITQMEEMPGDRLVMSDRLLSVTTPNGGQIEAIHIFRSIFRADPDSLDAIRCWSQSLQSAVSQNVERYQSRTIYPSSSIHQYIETGHWGPDVDVDRDVVRRHVGDLAQALRTLPNFHIGLVDDDVPFSLLVKGENQALVHIRRDGTHGQQEGPGVAFRSTRPDVTGRFRDYFDDRWERIPPEQKDSAGVADWLERQLASVTA